MNKVISLLTVMMISTPVLADYKSDDYNSYGYAAGASVIYGTELKGGLRGSHVSANHHRENSYYPGHLAAHPKNDK